jgi:hypothetical protein
VSIRDGVIALLDTVPALGQRNYADNAPEGTAYPYTVLKDEISRTPQLEGDRKTLWWKWMGQVDYWFQLSTEDEVVIDSIVDTLDGVPVTDGRVLRVTGINRVTDPLYDAGHTALTISTVRPR